VADGLYGVLSGRLTVTFATAEGRELILGMRMPGQLFGEFALIDGATRSATVVARDASSALFIARHIILPFLYRHPELVLRLAVYMSELIRRGTDHIADVSLLGIPQRLAKVLIALAGAKLAVSVSQDELSRILGVSREVVNRQLALWREGGFVKLARGRIILLDDGAMRRIAKTGQVSTRRG
jgi:CRP/FNR family cyclic AMP-dependent transcriptional regulator